jgi:carboxynorspermidine decarboxylase
MPDHPETGLYRGDVPRLLAAFERSGLDTPCFVLDQTRFRHNGAILKRVQDETGAKILLAQKAFACFGLYPLLRDYLVGTAASGLHEARLGHEEFGGEVHVFSPAYKPAEMTEVLKIADHLVFNSLGQWHRYRDEVLAAGPRVSAGLRINPE